MGMTNKTKNDIESFLLCAFIFGVIAASLVVACG